MPRHMGPGHYLYIQASWSGQGAEGGTEFPDAFYLLAPLVLTR